MHEAASKAANAPDDSIDDAWQQMRELLGALKTRYGEHPILLATEADYVDDPDVAIGLLFEAYGKAVAKGEVDEVVSIAAHESMKHAASSMRPHALTLYM